MKRPVPTLLAVLLVMAMLVSELVSCTASNKVLVQWLTSTLLVLNTWGFKNIAGIKSRRMRVLICIRMFIWEFTQGFGQHQNSMGVFKILRKSQTCIFGLHGILYIHSFPPQTSPVLSINIAWHGFSWHILPHIDSLQVIFIFLSKCCNKDLS